MKLAAPPEEHLLEGSPPGMAAAWRRFAWIVFFCVLAHAGVISLVGRFGGPGGLIPAEQEVPIEVIEEPQPQKEPEQRQSKNEQQAKQATLDEKEATEAPRESAKKEKDVLGGTDKPATEKAEPKPAEAAGNPDKAVPANAQEDTAQQTKNDRPDGEVQKTAEQPRPGARDQTKAEKTAPQPEKQQTEAPSPAPAAAPENSFAAAMGYSPVGGGNAQTTYLTTVYGMVTPHMDLKKVAAGRAHQTGEIVFGIDYGGALLGAKVIKSTGLRDVDAAAIAAVRAAAPFPLPPTGSGITLSLKFSGK
jgi:TonB family protein